MRTSIVVNGTTILLSSIIKFAQPEAGKLGTFFPRQWLDPSSYVELRTMLQQRAADEKSRGRSKAGYYHWDIIEIPSGGFLWLYHLDADGNMRSDAFTLERGVRFG